MTYRSVATSIWMDDAILGLDPIQKLLFLYLHTNPYASACGIYKMSLRTMGFQLGLHQEPFESALNGLCAVMPDFVAVDWETNEVALLQYPKQTLITAGKKLMAHVSSEIQKVESPYLLKELIARNSATLSKPYLEHLRRISMEKINKSKIHDNLHNFTDNQEDTWKTKTLTLTKQNSPPTPPQNEGVERGGECVDIGSQKEVRTYDGYKKRMQLGFPALYQSDTRILTRLQYEKMLSIETELEESELKNFTGLVYEVHELLNKNREYRDKYNAVSELLNIKLQLNNLPIIA